MAQAGADTLKHDVAERALAFVEDGMRLGLGTGTTAKVFVDLLADRVRQGLRVRCVPTSEATDAQARGLGIEVVTLDEMPALDLTIDGADEFDPSLNLIKGGGGALLREKIVAAASASMIVIADTSKRVERLGKFPLPIEVNRFGLAATTRLVRAVLDDLGLSGELVVRQRPDAKPFMTDGGHLIVDAHLGVIPAPGPLAAQLLAVPGVVEHGLFIGYARAVVTNAPGGGATVIERI